MNLALIHNTGQTDPYGKEAFVNRTQREANLRWSTVSLTTQGNCAEFCTQIYVRRNP